MDFPTPHLEKLTKTLENEKLPRADQPRIEAAIERYRKWIGYSENIEGVPDEVLERMVGLMAEYKLYIDIELIFDSPEDFLYRQKGQLKLDNSIIEEFLPRLVVKYLQPNTNLHLGPTKCFSEASFTSTLDNALVGGGLHIRTKDHDFAISRKIFIQTSYDSDFTRKATSETFIAYVVAECKTNLDKTMFQEASATAHDVKSAVAGEKYFLLVEWLDMTPLSTAATDIDEVLILRKAKRLNSNIRSRYYIRENRQRERQSYLDFLNSHPFSPDIFKRFVSHIIKMISNEEPEEESVLKKGYF
jgi:hypothetical protein